MALKNREEMLEKFISENNQLKDKVKTLEKLAERLKLEKTEMKYNTSKKPGLDSSTHFPVVRSAGNATGGPRHTNTLVTNSTISQSHVRFSINDDANDLKKRAESSEKSQETRSGSKVWRNSTSLKRTSSLSGRIIPFSKKVSSKAE